MRIRSTRRRRQFGWPEVWLALFVLGAIAPATLWWRQHYEPQWPHTNGIVTFAEAIRVHYNAQDYRIKANVKYEYLVGLTKYTGGFDGFWPDVGSPNALLPTEIESLQSGREVVVFYDPVNPVRSRLHPRLPGASPYWLVLTAIALGIAGTYTFVVYPARRA